MLQRAARVRLTMLPMATSAISISTLRASTLKPRPATKRRLSCNPPTPITRRALRRRRRHNSSMRTALLAAALFFFAAAPAFAASLSELHITAEGKFSAKNVVVLQKSGTTLFCRGTWGNAFVRITVLTTPDTIPALILRNHGGTTTVDEIRQGDLLLVEGPLVPAADA